MKLNSCAIFAAGIAGTGKTTVFRRLVEIIDNSLYLSRDSAAQQILTVDPNAGLPGKFPEGLMKFGDYVQNDSDDAKDPKRIETPFGSAFQIGQRTAYNARHGINQCDLVTYAIARDNLEAGKVSLIDSLTPRRFKAREVEKVFDSNFFAGFPISLVYFHFSDLEQIRARILERGQNDSYARTRIEYQKAQTLEEFNKYVETTQKDFTDNFGELDIFRLDVLNKTPSECADEIISYVMKK